MNWLVIESSSDALEWPIETGRLLIRRATRDDLKTIWALRRLPEVHHWLEAATVTARRRLSICRDRITGRGLEQDRNVAGVDRAQLVVSLRDAWRDVLGVEPTDDSDFYEQGGDSLTAAEVVNRVVERHPDVTDLDFVTLTAMLEEARFESVVDAVCSELGITQSDPAPPAAPSVDFRTGNSALGSGELEAELASAPPGDGGVAGQGGMTEDGE
jgi:Phosphopantetheine attachment site